MSFTQYELYRHDNVVDQCGDREQEENGVPNEGDMHFVMPQRWNCPNGNQSGIMMDGKLHVYRQMRKKDFMGPLDSLSFEFLHAASGRGWFNTVHELHS